MNEEAKAKIGQQVETAITETMNNYSAADPHSVWHFMPVHAKRDCVFSTWTHWQCTFAGMAPSIQTINWAREHINTSIRD